MAPDSPDLRRQSPTAADLESGDRIEQDSSPPSSEPSIQKHNPEVATRDLDSREVETAHPRDRWRDSPRWKSVERRIPPPITRYTRKAVGWVKGPRPPAENRIKPLFEPLQTFHIRLLARLPRIVRICLFVGAFMLWIVLFGVILSKYSLPQDIGGFGAPVRLACTAKLWTDAPNCGLDGQNCLPFEDSAFAFTCPAACAGVSVLNPRTIGDEQIVYQPFVIGGADNASEVGESVYRGDSFICGAAIHAGVLKDSQGGCGVLSLVGEKTDYGSVSRNGISSVGFDSSFPMSIAFNRSEPVLSASTKCQDPRWDLLILSTIFTAMFALFTIHPATFFGPVFVITYWQISMASDPPSYTDYPSLASSALGDFLPAAFIAVLIYQFSVRKTLKNLRAQYEKTILWVGGLWVGALNNLTLDNIPIQRLTPHDLHQQPGAMTALVIIILVLVAIVLYQAWCFRLEGRLPRYLGLYATLALLILILIGVPSLDLRIHHYILALLLLPGTATQTRLSLLFQGLLVGLFINGVARWGFASILQTAADLRGDAQLGSDIPSILPPLIANASNITFTWEGLAQGYAGVSVLVNDVERFRGTHEEEGAAGNFTWARRALGHPEYFRFGFVSYAPFGGVTYSDFTMAGTWWPNGTWSGIPDGRSSG